MFPRRAERLWLAQSCTLQTNPRLFVQPRGDTLQGADLEDKSMIQDYGSYSYRLLMIILGGLKRKNVAETSA